MQDHDAALDTLAQELGIDPEELGGSAWVAAITSFLLFAVGAIIPVLAYFFVAGTTALIISVVLSVIGLFVIGAAITVITGRGALRSGLQQVLFGVAAATITFGVGRLFGTTLVGRPGKGAQVDLVAGLRQPEAYPWRPDTVDMVETHISWVFLAGDKVVEVKRPVAYGFVDHTSPEARHQSCLDEVRLNRRLTDDVYLGVVPIVRKNGGYLVGGQGTPLVGNVDAAARAGHARCPPGRQSRSPDLAARLARRLIPFHRDLAPSCGCTRTSRQRRLRSSRKTWIERAIRPEASLGPIQFDLVATSMRQFVATRDELLRERERRPGGFEKGTETSVSGMSVSSLGE